MDPLLAEFLTDTIAISGATSVDLYGKRAFAQSQTYPCRVVYETRLIRKQDGRDVVETGRAYIDGNPAITTDSKITLGDGSSPVVVSVDPVTDENGAADHVVVRFGTG
jgi:hypothetical protein